MADHVSRLFNENFVWHLNLKRQNSKQKDAKDIDKEIEERTEKIVLQKRWARKRQRKL